MHTPETTHAAAERFYCDELDARRVMARLGRIEDWTRLAAATDLSLHFSDAAGRALARTPQVGDVLALDGARGRARLHIAAIDASVDTLRISLAPTDEARVVVHTITLSREGTMIRAEITGRGPTTLRAEWSRIAVKLLSD